MRPETVVYFLREWHGGMTWSSWRCPCSLQGDWTRWSLKVPCKPNHSVVIERACSSRFMALGTC